MIFYCKTNVAVIFYSKNNSEINIPIPNFWYRSWQHQTRNDAIISRLPKIADSPVNEVVFVPSRRMRWCLIHRTRQVARPRLDRGQKQGGVLDVGLGTRIVTEVIRNWQQHLEKCQFLARYSAIILQVVKLLETEVSHTKKSPRRIGGTQNRCSVC